MKLLANENFPLKSFKALQEKGYDIKHIGIELPSITDEEVMAIAIEEGRIIITFDSDYGELVYKYGYKPPGVIYLRWKEFTPDFPADYLHEIFKAGQIQFAGLFTVIDENQIRQRKITG